MYFSALPGLLCENLGIYQVRGAENYEEIFKDWYIPSSKALVMSFWQSEKPLLHSVTTLFFL